MVAIIRTEWSGTSGGPGLTQLACEQFTSTAHAQDAVDNVRAFWQAIAGLLPNELTLQVNPQVDVYDTVGGQLINTVLAPVTPAAVLGTAANVYLGGAGFKVTWETGVIKNGRRVRGSTFIVPASSGAFTATGAVGSTSQTTVNTAANNLIAAMAADIIPLMVWSRPVDGPPARVGDQTEVIQGLCSTKSAIMRSRRD